MASIEKLALSAHPAAPAKGVHAVSVRLHVHETWIWIAFEVDHTNAIRLPDHLFGRQDELWRSTCFEMFARRPNAAPYVEYNFAPIAAWAAYEFDGYREGMRNASVADPHLVDGRIEDRASEIDHFFEFCVVVSRQGILVEDDILLGLSAVIEETDGTKSYWALRHPLGDKPDFHHPDCFALELPSS